MFTVSETVTIERPRAEVFDFLIDGRNRPQWDSSVVFEKLTPAEPVAVGSTIHSRLRAMGRESDFHWRVTQFDPPSRMSTLSTSGPVGAGHTASVLSTDSAGRCPDRFPILRAVAHVERAQRERTCRP
ncbi:SRPBCC family protein [Microbacterium sp.]|uniref:SRPBCC family protein n=1 Tax=Microbacterium sp. TaxID=51671 RepID=UPI003F709E40